MENLPFDVVEQELDGLAPNLQKLQRGKLAMVPDNYFENLAEELTRQGVLTLMIENAGSANMSAELDGSEIKSLSSNGIAEFTDNILPAFMAELEKEKESLPAPQHKNRALRLSFSAITSTRWMTAAAAILILIIAFIIYFPSPTEKIPDTYTSQLTEEESYVFVEENLDDLTLDELIDHGFIEPEDVSLVPATSLPTSNDTL